MKRFLALFAVVAMVVSMFSGVVFAAPVNMTFHVQDHTGGDLPAATLTVDGTVQALDPNGKVVLPYEPGTTVTYSATHANYLDEVGVFVVPAAGDTVVVKMGRVTVDLVENVLPFRNNSTTVIRGRLLHENTKALVRITGNLNTNGVDIPVTNGEFSHMILTSDSAAPLTFAINDYDIAGPVDGKLVKPKAFTVAPEMVLEQPSTLEYVYPVSGQQSVIGVFPNGDGKDGQVAAMVLRYDDGTLVATGDPSKTGFIFLFNDTKLAKTGNLEVVVTPIIGNPVVALKGKVKAGALDVTMDKTQLPRLLGPQKATFNFNLPSKYFDNAGVFKAGAYNLKYQVKDESGAVVIPWVDFAAQANIKTGNQKSEQNLGVNALDPGLHKVTVLLEDKPRTTDILTKTIDLQIVDPSEYTLTAMVKDVKVGDNPATNTINFAELGGNIAVTHYDGTPPAKFHPYITVTYEGAGLKSTTVKSLWTTAVPADDGYATAAEGGKANFLLKPTETGTITMKVNVYDNTQANDGKLVHTFTEEIKVKGWNVEISPAEVLVDVAQDFVVTVKDESGNPVNNAKVTLDPAGVNKVLDGSLNNIIDGTYVLKNVKFNAVKKVDLHVDKYQAVGFLVVPTEVVLADVVNIVGASVYSVEADKDVLVNGIEDKVLITALDSEGNPLYPEVRQVDFNAKGEEILNQALPSGTRKDLDNDGVKEAIEVKVTPSNKAVQTVIRVLTDAGKKKGEVALEVQAPKLVHTGATKVTENFKTKVEFKVLDPRDDSVVTGALVIAPEKVAYVPNWNVDTILGKDMNHVWRAEYTTWGVDWDKLKEDKAVPSAKVMLGTVEVGKIEIAKPVLSADPEKAIIGAPTNMILTYTDADGTPYKNRKVELEVGVGNWEEVGTTDEEGKVVFSTATGSSLTLVFRAATDIVDPPAVATLYTELKVKSTADLEGPVITAEVTGNTALITIADNVRVNKVLVNNKLVDMFFAMPEVTHMVNLKPGVNKFNVQAVDINNNYSQATLELSPEAPAVGDSFSFTLNEGTEWGVPVLVNGTTMVPIRLIESLGATLAWDGATKTATFTLDGNTVVVTIDKGTALVNGEEVLLPEKPYVNDQGRTMVPLRLISQELGFTVNYVSATEPIVVSRPAAE